jgi:hypothetical protein
MFIAATELLTLIERRKHIMKTYVMTCLCYLAIPMILFSSGCGTARPKEMPKTAPCTITVVKDGVPISGVDVSLFRSEGNGSLTISAYTNMNGVATIQTTWGNYSTQGAPVGTCKVTLTKHVSTPSDGVTDAQIEKFTPQEAEEYEKKREAEIDKLRPIPKHFSAQNTTPLEIVIEEKNGAKMTVDLNKM